MNIEHVKFHLRFWTLLTFLLQIWFYSVPLFMVYLTVRLTNKIVFILRYCQKISGLEKLVMVMFEAVKCLLTVYSGILGGSERTFVHHNLWWMAYIPDSRHVKRTVRQFDGYKVNVYTPDAKTSDTAVIFMHGGAWAFSSADIYSWSTSYMSERTGKVVISVDYRKAPRHPFPQGLLDCYNTVIWVQEHAAELGIDQSKVCLMGDSAGGNLATICTMLHRDRGGRDLNSDKTYLPLLCQVLMYPVSQAYTLQEPSYASNSKYGLSRAMMRYYISLYIDGDDRYVEHIGDPQVCEEIPLTVLEDPNERSPAQMVGSLINTKDLRMLTNPYVFPLMSHDMNHLPPAYITVGKQDILRDDAVWYSELLQQFGVPCECHEVDGAIHGFMLFGQYTDVAREQLEGMDRFIDSAAAGPSRSQVREHSSLSSGPSLGNGHIPSRYNLGLSDVDNE